jgi:hypothetical protein
MRGSAKAEWNIHNVPDWFAYSGRESLFLEKGEVIVMEKPDGPPETGCCPRFNPEPWDEKEITFQDKLFVEDHVSSFFHIPLNFGKVMVRNMEKIQQASAEVPTPVVLSDETSLWGSDIYIAVARDVPGAKMTRISGTFLTKVFEGPYKNAGQWAQQMKAYVEAKVRKTEKTYFFYTTCPKCAEAYGKNYTVLLAKV